MYLSIYLAKVSNAQNEELDVTQRQAPKRRGTIANKGNPHVTSIKINLLVMHHQLLKRMRSSLQ